MVSNSSNRGKPPVWRKPRCEVFAYLNDLELILLEVSQRTCRAAVSVAGALTNQELDHAVVVLTYARDNINDAIAVLSQALSADEQGAGND
jgi:hypothetical protein